MDISVGDLVRTPFGKGVVRERRNNGRLLVEVQGRQLELTERDVAAQQPDRAPRSPRRGAGGPGPLPPAGQAAARVRHELDLHGMTVAEALERVDAALNRALLHDAVELRLIHGRSGGRIRAAVHSRLRQIPTVRSFAIDPANDGVTIVRF